MTTDPLSPCTGVCRIDSATRLCAGCKRTIDEIMAWPRLAPETKRAVLARLALRGRPA
ncbi:MAG TPA: DUF1289 domain-containing protein [Novosphingobium sp.]|nr:DUF1289 domain-containing protein [Novosphingobium sp.]